MSQDRSQPPLSKELPQVSGPLHPFRRAVLRGLGVVLPPLLTIVIFVWVGNTVAVYLLEPVERKAEQALVWGVTDIRQAEEQGYVAVSEGNWIPERVYKKVEEAQEEARVADIDMTSATAVYEEYVRIRYLQRWKVILVFLCCFILLLYLLGKFLAAGVGKLFWGTFERGILQLPIVRNVYSSVKQVTDFLFSAPEIEYTRVVAVEYPRKGIWSLGMVTGESMLDISNVANEPVLSLLVPTSPMPFTGFTVTVKKSETIDLNITIDQAFQFIISCGVVVPPQQLAEALEAQETGTADHRVEPQEQPAVEA